MKVFSKLTIYLCIILFSNNLIAQNTLYDIPAKNTIYFEIGGESITPVSLNYDRVIIGRESSFTSINCGFGYFPNPISELEPIIGVPISLSWNRRLRKNSFLEIGSGLSFNSGYEQSYSRVLNITEKTIYRSIFATFRFGYRYQKPKYGFFFKAGFTPVLDIYDLGDENREKEKFMIGVAFGFSFERKK